MAGRSIAVFMFLCLAHTLSAYIDFAGAEVAPVLPDFEAAPPFDASSSPYLADLSGVNAAYRMYMRQDGFGKEDSPSTKAMIEKLDKLTAKYKVPIKDCWMDLYRLPANLTPILELTNLAEMCAPVRELPKPLSEALANACGTLSFCQSPLPNFTDILIQVKGMYFSLNYTDSKHAVELISQIPAAVKALNDPQFVSTVVKAVGDHKEEFEPVKTYIDMNLFGAVSYAHRMQAFVTAMQVPWKLPVKSVQVVNQFAALAAKVLPEVAFKLKDVL